MINVTESWGENEEDIFSAQYRDDIRHCIRPTVKANYFTWNFTQLVLSFIYTQIIRGSRPHFKIGGFTNT